jgi:cytochrome c peroxidase
MTAATRPLAAAAGSGVAPLDGIDTPTLRDVWASAPYLHDGSATTVEEAIARHTTVVAPDELAKLADYVRQIGSEE